MLSSIKKMLDCFEKYKIRYCHWKSNEHIEKALLGDTDLDILVLPNQRCELERALGEAELKRFRAMPLMQYNAIEDYIGFDKDEVKIWHLHLHYRLTLGEKHLKSYTMPWTEHIVSRRHLVTTEQGGIYCSNPADELFLLYIRIALKLRWRDFGKKIGKDELMELAWLKGRVQAEDLRKSGSHYFDEVTIKEFDELFNINPLKKNKLFRLQRVLRRKMNNYTAYNRWTSWMTRSRREIFWFFGGTKKRIGLASVKPCRRISPSGGTVVAFLGCDGAGKSTLLSYVRKEFNKKIDVYTAYLGSGYGSSSLLRRPMKLVARKIGGKGYGHEVEERIASGNRIRLKTNIYLLAKIVWAITLAKEKKRKLKKITSARNNGMLVLIDRYPQTEISGYNDGPLLSRYKTKKGIMRRISEWEYKIYREAYLNVPDLLVKLTVPTEIAIQRKPEMFPEEIDKKKKAVQGMHLGCKEIEIDTSFELNVSLRKVMQAIWDEI